MAPWTYLLLAQHLGLAASTTPGVVGWGHCRSWLVSIQSWASKGLLYSPSFPPVQTKTPFKTPCTPRWGATMGLHPQGRPMALLPTRAGLGNKWATVCKEIWWVRGSDTWHQGFASLAERVFGQIPCIALELEQKPTRMQSCPSLHQGKPQSPRTLQSPVCEGTRAELLLVCLLSPAFFFFFCG